MDLYGLALFIHILGVVTLFGAFVLIQRVGVQIRGSEQVAQVQALAKLFMTTGNMFNSAAIFLIVTGLYMANEVWGFTTSWVVVGLVTLVIIMGIGGTVARKGLQRIGQLAAAAPAGPVPDELRAAAREPNVWTVIGFNNAATLGVVWLMTNKPGWAASVAIVVVVGAIGAVLGRTLTQRP